ncbi:hypothetical protein, partial [Desulfovulcanus sp.]
EILLSRSTPNSLSSRISPIFVSHSTHPTPLFSNFSFHMTPHTDEGVKFILETLVMTAREKTLPIIFTLEGGYNLQALERCGEMMFRLMEGHKILCPYIKNTLDL